ncbi:MAG: trigger factor [Methylacidiphilales bacterium]|nr:trigger factor [Candidatus Methylacidiphilales bacterium]MDW8349010.1 trigger factor [Verrucomicrobiae bacterium]
MNITVEPINPCRKRLKIEIPADRVLQKHHVITQEFQKIAKIPGFRPGHAPTEIILKRYQPEIEAELKQTLIQEASHAALQQKNITPVSPLQVEDLQYIPGTTFSFSVLVDCQPDIQLPSYKNLTLKRHPDTVTDEQIQKIIEFLRHEHATYTPITDRPLALHDFAILDYEAHLDGQPLGTLHPEIKPYASRKNTWLHIHNDSLSLFPGFIQNCIGLSPGQSRSFQITIPDPHPPYPPLASKTIQFQVTLHKINTQTLPPLDDTLAQKCGHDNLQKLKEAIRFHRQQELKREIRLRAHNEIIDQLLKLTFLTPPESLVEKETERLYQKIIEENRARGVPIAKLEENHEQILHNAQQQAIQNVKIRLILNKIADTENIQISDQELTHAVLALAQQQKVTPQKYIQHLRQNNLIQDFIQELRNEKTLDHLLSLAIYTD